MIEIRQMLVKLESLEKVSTEITCLDKPKTKSERQVYQRLLGALTKSSYLTFLVRELIPYFSNISKTNKPGFLEDVGFHGCHCTLAF